jgi:hypothetical protein
MAEEELGTILGHEASVFGSIMVGPGFSQEVDNSLLVWGKGCFTVSTGQFALRETASATLPIKSLPSPVRP